MLETTLNATKEIMKADPSLSVGDRNKLIALLRSPMKPIQPDAKPEQRILRRAEVARRFGVTCRTVDSWAAANIFHKMKLPGRVRACGFSSQEIERLIAEGVKE